MYQFFVEPSQIQQNRVIITGSDVNHIKNVLRMKIGEELAVSNGVDQKEYRCAITSFEEDAVLCILNGNNFELTQKIPYSGQMEILTSNTEVGWNIYSRTLQYIFIKASLDIFKDAKIVIQHSISRGIFGEICSAVWLAADRRQQPQGYVPGDDPPDGYELFLQACPD